MKINGINFIYNVDEQGQETLTEVGISFHLNELKEYFNGSVIVTFDQYVATQGNFKELEKLVWARIESYVPQAV